MVACAPNSFQETIGIADNSSFWPSLALSLIVLFVYSIVVGFISTVVSINEKIEELIQLIQILQLQIKNMTGLILYVILTKLVILIKKPHL